MSKSILGIGLVIVGFALQAIPGIGNALGLGLIASSGIFEGVTVASVIGVGLLIAGSVLLGPSLPKMPASLANGGRERLFATLDARAPRKIAFGITAGPVDLLYR